jgi:hypothetical protein
MDVLHYLRNLASPFVVLAEIELALRRIIGACVKEDELQVCIRHSLTKKYASAEMPTELNQMTLNDYVQIIGDGRNWPHFEIVFGKGDWQRKTTAERLKEVNDLRNDAFHFRRPFLPSDYERLATQREWLQVKTRAFEARKYERVVVAEKQAESTSQKWDEASFFRECETKWEASAVGVARKILAWAKTNMPDIWWGEGKKYGCYIPGLNYGQIWHQVIGVWTNGYIEVQFQYMKPNPPFDNPAKRLELLRRLNQIPGVSLPEEAITGRPSIPISTFKDEPTLDQFLKVLNWVVKEIRHGKG